MTAKRPDRRRRRRARHAAALQSRARRLPRAGSPGRRGSAAPVAAEEQPDLVLLDWMLPQLSGIEVCRRLRGRSGNAQRAHHHADGARRGDATASAGSRYRRRRLPHQALLDDRAAGAAARRDAPHPPEPGRRRGGHRRYRDGPRRPSRAPLGQRRCISVPPNTSCSII